MAPDSPVAMDAPCPTTVELATALSLAWLPTTVEAAPVADAPKPPALAFVPDATACVAVTLLSETNGPDSPATRLLMASSALSSAAPTSSYAMPCTVYDGVLIAPDAAL